MTRASIIIPSRGGAHRLPVLLAALEQQTHADWEAVVVVDGDIDGSADVVETFSHLPIKTIIFPENRGRVAALNAGFEAADGDVLIRCDDDLEPDTTYVADHVAAHLDQPVGIIGLYLNVLEPGSYSRAYGSRADQLYRKEAYALPDEQKWRLWAGNCSVTRETWKRVGSYDMRYRAYGWEDVDYGYRIAKIGLPVRLVPALETVHRAAAINTQTRVKRAYRSGQARSMFDSIHGPHSSGPAAPRPESPWNIAVVLLSRALTFERSIRLSRALDRVIGRLPVRLVRKSIALLVESSAVAGYRSGPQTTLDF